MTWKLKQTQQCAKCPWLKTTDPHDIPNGYDVEKHQKLDGTIARDDVAVQLQAKTIRIMACHETHDAHCIGWLVNQAGPGNNVYLRMALFDCENADQIKLRGEQHERFEDTLPKYGKRKTDGIDPPPELLRLDRRR